MSIMNANYGNYGHYDCMGYYNGQLTVQSCVQLDMGMSRRTDQSPAMMGGNVTAPRSTSDLVHFPIAHNPTLSYQMPMIQPQPQHPAMLQQGIALTTSEPSTHASQGADTGYWHSNPNTLMEMLPSTHNHTYQDRRRFSLPHNVGYQDPNWLNGPITNQSRMNQTSQSWNDTSRRFSHAMLQPVSDGGVLATTVKSEPTTGQVQSSHGSHHRTGRRHGIRSKHELQQAHNHGSQTLASAHAPNVIVCRNCNRLVPQNYNHSTTNPDDICTCVRNNGIVVPHVNTSTRQYMVPTLVTSHNYPKNTNRPQVHPYGQTQDENQRQYGSQPTHQQQQQHQQRQQVEIKPLRMSTPEFRNWSVGPPNAESSNEFQKSFHQSVPITTSSNSFQRDQICWPGSSFPQLAPHCSQSTTSSSLTSSQDWVAGSYQEQSIAEDTQEVWRNPQETRISPAAVPPVLSTQQSRISSRAPTQEQTQQQVEQEDAAIPTEPTISINHNGPPQLWQFLLDHLRDPGSRKIINWTGRGLEFKLKEPNTVARLWGIAKNKPAMNYEKLSRGLRYYYQKDIIQKVTGSRYAYRFTENLQKIMNNQGAGSLLRGPKDISSV